MASHHTKTKQALPPLAVTDDQIAGVLELANRSLRDAAELNAQLLQVKQRRPCTRAFLDLAAAVAEIWQEHLDKCR